MDFSVLLVGETLSAHPMGLARAELCNRCASQLTAQLLDFIELFQHPARLALGMKCRWGRFCR
jgi:hypothetical protein